LGGGGRETKGRRENGAVARGGGNGVFAGLGMARALDAKARAKRCDLCQIALAFH